jgi:cell division inhibitor SepF
MSSKFLNPINKVMGAIGLVDEEDDDIDDEEIDEEDEDDNMVPDVINSRKNKVVSIKNGSAPRVILKKPQEFQNIMEIVDAVKSRRIVIMNLTELEQKSAQRMIDYIVGACYALNASFEEISRCIYIIAPENVEITNELKSELNMGGNDKLYDFDDNK